MIQLSLFEPVPIIRANLVADSSPRRAFYNIWIEQHMSEFRVRKQRGAGGKVFDERTWCFESFEAAEKEFNRRVREKTNPARRSARRYQPTGEIPHFP